MIGGRWIGEGSCANEESGACEENGREPFTKARRASGRVAHVYTKEVGVEMKAARDPGSVCACGGDTRGKTYQVISFSREGNRG